VVFHHKKLFSIFLKLRQEIIPDWSYIKISNQVYMIMEVKAEKSKLIKHSGKGLLAVD